MKKILLTCFLALPCLFQKAIIKLKAIKERLRLPGPPIALRCIESLTYLAAGVFHVAQRSVSRVAYLSVAIFHRPQGGIFRAAYLYKKATWIGIYVLIPILLCSSISPTLRKVAQSPPKPSLHRSAVPVSPHSGDTHRGGEARPDTFTALDGSAETWGKAIYTTDVSAIDGGPALRSPVSRPPASTKETASLRASARSDAPQHRSSGIRHRTSLPSSVSRLPASTKETASLRAFAHSDAPQHRTLVLSKVEASVIRHPTILLSSVSRLPFLLNFGLINPDQDMGAGEGTSGLQPAPVPVFRNQDSSGQEAYSQSTEAQSLVSSVFCLKSSDGLVDSDQDMGAGEGTSCLQPAPVPVFSNHNNSCQKAIHKGTKAQSLMASVLDLESSSSLGSSGTRAERSRSMDLTSSLVSGLQSVVVYVETKPLHGIDSLEFVLWDPYLNELELPYPDKSRLGLSPGNMYEGAIETARGQWESKPLAGFGRLTVRKGKFTYLDRFLVEPGDSVRIRLDFTTAQVLFSGPAAEKFRLQYQLALAHENYRYDRNPTMFTYTSDFWGYSEKDSLLIRDAQRNHNSIRRKMEYISSGQSGLDYLKRLFQEPIAEHPGFAILDSYQGKVSEEFLDILLADLIGKLNFERMSRFSTYYLEDSAHREFFREEVQTLPILALPSVEHSVFYPEFVYQQQAIISALTQTPFSKLATKLPAAIRDLVFAKFIVKNYRRFKDSNKQFELALSQIQTPWLLEEIQRLYAAQRIGGPISELPLVDLKGEEVSLRDLKGKTLFISFWLPGCQASSGAYEALIKPVQEALAEVEDLQFLYVSRDKNTERFAQNVTSGVYSDPNSLNLNAPGETNPFMDHYRIQAFPTFMIVDDQGYVQNIGNIPDKVQELSDYLRSFSNIQSSTPH